MEKLILGIELGSTRIKAVLTDEKGAIRARGSYGWENRFENGIWTYPYGQILEGLQSAYADLKADYKAKTGATVTEIAAIGVSAMMHGFIPLDKNRRPLAPFKTWRCGDAAKEAEELTELFGFPIPARWTVAHLYKAIKEGADYLDKLDTVTTLAGYTHLLLSGYSALGIGDASGVFPVYGSEAEYNLKLIEKFNALVEGKFNKNVFNLFPQVLVAGDFAGYLTEMGARLLDKDGELKGGALMCPPEGDAGTGMVATNSIKRLTGNVSAGTSVFSMTVLDKPLGKVYKGVDVVTTPVGAPVAMVHCNNCSSEINAWAGIFAEACGTDKEGLYEKLFKLSSEGDEDCGGVVACNYLSGENVTGVDKGTPFVLRTAGSKFNLANFMRAQLYSAFATLKMGNDEFVKRERIKIEKYCAHGGLFKTEGVCERYLAAALNTPVSVMTTAGEGGAWGMAILAGYAYGGNTTLEEYLEKVIFKGRKQRVVKPERKTVKGFNAYVKNLKKAIKAEKVFQKV